MKRTIAVGMLYHESNTFTPAYTGEKDFIIIKGKDIFGIKESKGDTFGEIKGMLKFFNHKQNYRIKPLICARALPYGMVKKEVYLKLKKELINRLLKIHDLSAVLLSLHGSMYIEDIGDGEGDLLSSIRNILPQNVLIVCTLDMHATVTRKMVKNANAFVAYKTAPHTDVVETGIEAGRLLYNALENSIIPRTSCSFIPMLISGEQSETGVEPMKGLINSLKVVERQPGVLSASYCLGFPWADHSENFVSAIVVSKLNEIQSGKVLAKKLADSFWQKRKEFRFITEAFTPQASIKRAVEYIKKNNSPVFISDSGDNPTAGSPEDNTNLLKIIDKMNLPDLIKDRPLFAVIYDPEAVNRCLDSVNKDIEIFLGGRIDSIYSKPYKMKGKVEKVVKRGGTVYVLMRIPNVDVVISSRRVGITDVNIFQNLGIDLRKRKIVIVKSGYLVDDLRKVASCSILSLTNGCTDLLLNRLPYKRLKHPVFPIDKI
ncbi:MAG: M81 family metallopeptidase [bacterium]|nr:M81 family metallopeptidase [bacterium]